MALLFLWLGFWQLDRADQKEQAVAEQKLRGVQERLPLTGDEMDSELVRYREIEVRGHFLTEAQFFLDNRKHDRVAGYHVMVPMRIEGSGRAVLVNRGWIAQGKSRAESPLVAVPAGLQHVVGVVRVPTSHGFRLQQEADAAVRLYLDLEQIGDGVGLEMLPFVVRQQSGAENLSDGLVRQWKRDQRESDPAMHYGYALQWFAFALLLLGGWLAVVIKQRRESAV